VSTTRGATDRKHVRLRPRQRPQFGTRALCILGLLLLAACSANTPPSPSAAADPGSSTNTLGPSGGVTASSAGPPLRVILNWTVPSATQAPMWVAFESGMFGEQGLDVELTNVPGTAQVLQAMVAGEIHLSPLDPASAVQATLGGADTVLLFGLSNRFIFSIMSQPSIQQPQALRGKTLGFTRLGGVSHTGAVLTLRKWGLVPNQDVTLRELGQLPAIIAALEAGQVDAGMVALPAPRDTRARFHELINLITDGPEYVASALGGPRAWVGANEEALRRFTRAYVQGVHRAKTDKSFTVAVLRKYLQTDDGQLLEDSYAQFDRMLPNVPYVSEAGLDGLLSDMAAEDPRVVGHRASEFIDSHFVRDLEASGFIRQVMGDAP